MYMNLFLWGNGRYRETARLSGSGYFELRGIGAQVHFSDKAEAGYKKGIRESRGRVVLFSVKNKLISTSLQSNLGMKIKMEFSTSSSQSKDHICCLYSRKEQYNVYCVKIYIHMLWRQGIVNGNQVYGAPYLT